MGILPSTTIDGVLLTFPPGGIGGVPTPPKIGGDPAISGLCGGLELVTNEIAWGERELFAVMELATDDRF